jgi:hypothetical protein
MKGYKTKGKKVIFNKDAYRTKSVTTSTGITITAVPVDPLMFQTIINSVKYPKKPTYNIKTELVDETHELDWTVVEQEDDAALQLEYKQKLTAYEQETAAADNALQMKILKYVISKGVDAEIPSEGDYTDLQDFLELTPSTNRLQAKYDYIVSTVIGCDVDIKLIMDAVMEVTGVPQESLDAARASFRIEVDQEQDAEDTAIST